jgi:steroid delta-isomerase-like uncharacterized protein
VADLDGLIRSINDEVLSKGNYDVIDDLVADDFVEHEEMPGLPTGKDSLRAFVEMFRSAFPDLKAETLAVAVDGDEVWAHSRMTGTHQGEFNGIPPTGKSFSVEMIDRVRTRDGKAVEHWGVSDTMGMMTQLGVIPG